MVRRGFAAEADRLATAVRSELGLGAHDRLDPRLLADLYGVPVCSLADLVEEGADPSSIERLTAVDPGCFSAGTVLVGSSRLIIVNPVHPPGRSANSLAHELAHLLLEHTPGPAMGPGGCRVWDQDMEDEATLLASILLVPRDAALACARAGLPHPIGAARFGVSTELMQWRTNHSGAARQAQAAARQRGRTIPRLGAADLRSVMSTCDLAWLQEITADQWRRVLSASARALSSGSVSSLVACLTEQ
jgi:Zn-dependent peptidase ImmA (M78 family)